MHQPPQPIVAVPTSAAVVAAPDCHVQIIKTDDGGYTFHADVIVGGVNATAVFGEAAEVYYDDPARRTALGWHVAGIADGPEDAERFAPLFNAIADLKVLVDVGVAILAGHLRAIGRTNMLAVKPGAHAALLATEERASIAPERIDVALWEAQRLNQGSYIIDTANATSMAATLIAESAFKPNFMQCFEAVQGREAIVGLYARMVIASARVAKLHSGLALLEHYRPQYIAVIDKRGRLNNVDAVRRPRS